MTTETPAPADNVLAPVPETSYAHASWRALGTYVQLVVARADLLQAAEAEAVRLLDAIDLAASRFREDSDLMRANRQAGQWVEVSSLLASAVTAALWAAEETDGLVDLTLGRSLAAVGYDRDLTQVQTEDHGPTSVPIPAVPDAWRQVRIRDDGDRAELFVPAGVGLDLGATGKAFAADLLARQIAEVVGTDLVVSVGGDVAIGSVDEVVNGGPTADGTDSRTDPAGTGPTSTRPGGVRHEWRIAVGERPDDEPGQLVVLHRGGMATSSTMHRRWTRGGQAVHHLLDPRTGRPVERSWRTVTVAAPSCLAANMASTASIVLGEHAPEWLAERDFAARLVGTTGNVITVAGWPEEGN